MQRIGAAGLGLAVLSAATFGTAGPFGDSLLAAGWTPAGAATLRIGIAALALLVPAARALRGRWHLLRRQWRTAVLYGVTAVAVPQLFFFNAVQHLSVGVALLLEYCGTLLVVLWMWLVHGHRPSRLTTVGGVLALGGLVLVLDLTGAQRVDLVGVLWALGAAVGLASYFVLSSSSPADAGEPLPPIVMAGAGMASAAIALIAVDLTGVLPFRTATADVRLAGAAVSWLVPVLGVSLIAAVVAYATGIAAARRLGARVASFVGLAEVLFAILFSWALLDQRPALLQGVGAVVVLVGIALVRAGDGTDPERSDTPDTVAVEPV
ncbi:DMT family transporter [uncultured Jatrophihabitans sp.]|uniref:EamA family transporter n=1 Tax=uncultured Jatrophihabitans sp. TaxID=1610747 RepID=UPI0035CA9F9C